MLLKKLTDALGISGNEKEVRDIIVQEIKDFVDEIKIDRIGNVIAYKKGANPNNHIALTAHMDEVGFLVKGIDDNGLIKFTPVGGIDARILVSKPVIIGSKKLRGVIGAKAIHMQKPKERKKALSIDELYIDIGCASKAQAEELVSIGDYIGFDSEFIEFGKNRIKAKALDNRVGCTLLVEVLKKDLPVDVTGVFTVQEEVGLRGAEVAANQLEADLVVVLEGTTCSDVTGTEPHFQATQLDLGPAISIMDRTSIYNRKYVDWIISIAKENNIPWQYRKTTFGGNDAGRFHSAKAGTSCISLAVPCRYIHSPASVISKDDFYNLQNLLFKMLDKINEGGVL